jgi:hypothetical protein
VFVALAYAGTVIASTETVELPTALVTVAPQSAGSPA